MLNEIEKLKNELVGNNSYDRLKKLLAEANWRFLVVVLDRFYKVIGKTPYLAADIEVKKFILDIASTYKHLGTIRTYIIGLKRIYEMGVTMGLMNYNPVQRLEDMRLIKIPRSDFYSNVPSLDVTIDKINLFITTPEIPDRIKAIVLFLANTGCRISELIGLENSNITLRTKNEGYDIKLYEPKTNKVRYLILPKQTFDWIRDNINRASKFRKNKNFGNNTGNDYFLVNGDGNQITRQAIWQHLKKYWNRIFPDDKIHPHAFRHFFITHKAIIMGVPIAQVCREVGHASVNTTMRYTHTKIESGDYDLVKIPELTDRPNVVIIDKTAEIMSHELGIMKREPVGVEHEVFGFKVRDMGEFKGMSDEQIIEWISGNMRKNV